MGGSGMARTLKELLRDIERKRECLNRAEKRLGIKSPYVLKKSQELDALLNEYVARTTACREK